MMNEDRIREIANLASDHAESTADPFWDLEDGLNYAARLMKARDLKFAELIVRECAEQLELVRKYRYDRVQPLENQQTIVDECQYQIKQHFGIDR
jgi:hypothetical protein